VVNRAGVLLEPGEATSSCGHEGLGIFAHNATIEVLRERVENAATTIRNKRNAGKSGRIISSAPSLLY
jgi:hypothetical protein